ncbi:ricin-type beta-trefoil lectin domain protein [Streptomyces sp. A012304]|uniref:ricin-type beta-trefoil lectin domain protein n=1 Tax=Streptomyces sp. A012304 TaxID=375446 RepID=UPI002232743B|nr:ricin-type beta-trefoil lectin domain protein [Streptomyces sp. A012304]GKQ41342.1 lipase [Streptomyces sp. A012304]
MRKSWFLPLVTLVAAVLGVTAAGVTPAAAAPNTPLRVMPLGDSITWGVGSSTGNGYRGPLWNRLAADGHPLDFVGTGRNGPMSDPDNEGHSGYKIHQIAALADASLTRYRPNVVTLHIGTNDLNESYQVSTATDRLKSLVNQITAAAPDATVLVASLVVSTSGSEERYRAAYNQAIPRIVSDAQAAGKKVAHVDMSSLTTADLVDALHPNDSGYQKMADAFHRGVQSADSAGWLKNPAPAPARVESGTSGKCLDVKGAATADGTAAQIWACSGGANQLWSAYTDGTLRSMGKCLDAAGGGTANGTKVQLWSCHGGSNQVWQPYNGGYRNLASGRCLDIPGFSTADGTQLHLWDCHGGSNQRWTTLATG